MPPYSFQNHTDTTHSSGDESSFSLEDATSEQQKQFTRALLNASINGIYSVKAIRNAQQQITDFRYLFANQTVAGLLQMEVDNIVGKTILEVFPENRTNGFFDLFCETLDSKQPHRSETYFQTQKITSWFDYSIVPLDDDVLMVTLLDISNHKKALLRIEEQQQELRKYVSDLQRLNANLQEFAHAASHDLKEPVRKIHFFADRLSNISKSKWTDEELMIMNRIKDATRKMNTLIDDLFVYSLSSRDLPKTEDVDLNVVLQKVVEDLELQIHEKQAVVSFGKLPVIQGNSRQMEQLFQNLVNNALKYSKSGEAPQIRISSGKANGDMFGGLSRTKDDYFWIKVEDNGIGFNKEDADRIFNVFVRLHGNNEYAGTGVGLSIVQKVIANHRGKIIADSTPGKGATFTMILPQKQSL